MTGVRGHDLRLLPAALAVWLASALSGLLPIAVAVDSGRAVIVAVWLVAGLALAVAVALRGRRGATVAVLVGVALAGAALAVTSVAVSAPERHPPALREAADSRAVVSALVRVDTAARPLAAGGVWFDATALRLDEEEVSAPVRVFLAEPGGRLPVAAELVLEARADGGGVVGESTLLTASAVAERSPPTGVAAVAEVLRATFLDRAGRLGGDVAGLLPGLATGDTSALDAGLEDDMRTASLTHLTAVSGANCAVVVIAGWSVAALLGAGRRLRTCAALAVLAAFVVLVTPEPSVVRAAAMASVVLLARLGRRSGAAVPSLLASVIVLVVLDPGIAGQLGFVLSVLATAGLLLFAEPIARRLGALLPRPLALVLAVPIAAQAACQPVVLLVDPSVPVYGVLANLLAEPAAPAATGLGLIGCLLAPWWPAAADAVIGLAAVPAWWIAAIARAVASWPSPRLAWWPGVGGVVALTVLTVLGLLLVTRSARLAPVRRLSGFVLAGALVAAGASTVATPLLRSAAIPADWRIAMCDVGQGDALLLRGDAGVLLVDTGPLPEPLDACLDLLGVDRIALLVLTHYDLDHVGGLEAAVGRVDLALVGPSDGADDDRDRRDLEEGGASVREAVRGDSGALGSLRWRVEWPERGSSLRGNPASVTLRVDIAADARGAPLSVAMLGDLGEEEQGRVARLDMGRVDVMKVAHHGSSDQSPALYDALGARIGLISVGAGNDYGHPNPSLLALLAERGTEALRTDLDGTVVLSSRSDGVAVWVSGVALPSAASRLAHPPQTDQASGRRYDLRARTEAEEGRGRDEAHRRRSRRRRLLVGKGVRRTASRSARHRAVPPLGEPGRHHLTLRSRPPGRPP
ncbi:MBL fold metallo-hydrolase [Rathayibacter sp. VKM Ac-2803]|uniref:ComEC/Rec2 family competence protein n=1 Tax=Rathayibacter sp. VKM Ac-2803 TaxID=2609256 RepID=UPI0013594695|nr:ComEC/Rec2 family competence protein [Rathayibacter sp. VKM Ac-2803]MWV50286.1 MBL fold metallo-hydrolase [Rathayibacter sp. VKM Ac-2803]